MNRWRRLLGSWVGPPRSGAVILTYHRVVASVGEDPFRLQVSAERFDAHMAFLARAASAISLAALAEGLERRELRPRYPVVITFDDGYLDNHRFAAPILRRHGLPAVMFLATDFIGGGRLFWWDEVQHMLSRTRDEAIEIEPPVGRVYRLDDPAARREAAEDLCVRLRELTVPERERALEAMARRCGGRPPADGGDRPMTWGEARALRADGIDFGAHTRRHPALGSLERADARREIEGSRKAIEDRLQVDVEAFSYPHDDRDARRNRLSERSRDLVAEAGFRTAVTIVPGVNRPGQDLLALRRVTVRNWTTREFERRIQHALRSPD